MLSEPFEPPGTPVQECISTIRDLQQDDELANHDAELTDIREQLETLLSADALRDKLRSTLDNSSTLLKGHQVDFRLCCTDTSSNVPSPPGFILCVCARHALRQHK